MIPFSFFHKNWCREKTQVFLNSPFTVWFRDSPEYMIEDYQSYLQVIKSPVWLNLVSDRLKHDVYRYVHEWVNDMNNIWENAILFNPPDSGPYELALYLQHFFRKLCLPVPSSQKEVDSIDIQKKVLSLLQHLQNIPLLIKKLNWNIPQIDEITPIQTMKIKTTPLPPEVLKVLHELSQNLNREDTTQEDITPKSIVNENATQEDITS